MQTTELGFTKGQVKDRQAPEGFVYFIETEDARFVKIGYSIRPVQRLSELGTLRPGNFSLRIIGWMPGTKHTERWLHAKFVGDRDKGEWFKDSIFLRKFIASIGLIEPVPEPEPTRTEPELEPKHPIVRQVYSGPGCLRCGYVWTPKVSSPRQCPHCKATKWDRPANPVGRPRKKKAKTNG